MGDHERGTLQLLDHPRHRRRLAGAGRTEQRLEPVPGRDGGGELLDRASADRRAGGSRTSRGAVAQPSSVANQNARSVRGASSEVAVALLVRQGSRGGRQALSGEHEQLVERRAEHAVVRAHRPVARPCDDLVRSRDERSRCAASAGRARRSRSVANRGRTRVTIPADDLYHSFFAAWTRQNKRTRPGRYRFYLAHDLDTSRLADGRYTVEVQATDIRGIPGARDHDLDRERPPVIEPNSSFSLSSSLQPVTGALSRRALMRAAVAGAAVLAAAPARSRPARGRRTSSTCRCETGVASTPATVGCSRPSAPACRDGTPRRSRSSSTGPARVRLEAMRTALRRIDPVWAEETTLPKGRHDARVEARSDAARRGRT